MGINRIGNLKKYYPDTVFVPDNPDATFNTIYQVAYRDSSDKEQTIIYFSPCTLNKEQREGLGEMVKDRKKASLYLNDDGLNAFALFMIKDFPLISKGEKVH
jgi:hypothetical protein